MQLDLRSIPADGWTPRSLPEFPCCPNPQLEDLAEVGRDASSIDELLEFLQDSFASTLFAFGQILRDHLPSSDLHLPAGDVGQLRQGNSAMIVHHGNLVIDGDLQPPSALLVTGDITVNGVLRDTGKIVVLGNLHCHSFGSEAWVIIGGDCVARDFVYGSYNDDMLEVLGKISARAVVTDDHAIHAEDGLHVVHEPEVPGVSWEPEVFDLWDEGHREELLTLFGEEIHQAVPREKFDAFDEE